jgi:hypothetical protein
MWNLEGMTVTGTYLDDFLVTGKVESSRVAYGGSVKHTVVLDEPLAMRWRKEPATRLILDHEKIIQVRD